MSGILPGANLIEQPVSGPAAVGADWLEIVPPTQYAYFYRDGDYPPGPYFLLDQTIVKLRLVVEAIAVGVVRRTLSQALRYATLAIALRRRNLSSVQAKAVVKHAEDFRKKGLPYDRIGAAGVGLATHRGRLLADIGCRINFPACIAGRAMVESNGHLEKSKVSLQNKESPLCPCA